MCEIKSSFSWTHRTRVEGYCPEGAREGSNHDLNFKLVGRRGRMIAHIGMILALCVGLAASRGDLEGSDPSYDHQTVPYTTKFQPSTVPGGAAADVEVTPFFSPEYSAPTIVKLIQSAEHSIDIGTPGFSSWSGCTPFDQADKCTNACTPLQQRNESFPVFQALLNAVHRGVKVRIITNDYNTPDCPGTISPLPFLALNGVEVRYYASTTFYHAKFVMVDGVKLSISSINFSYTSFLKNREAGALITGSGAAPLLRMAADVYSFDFDLGTDLVPNKSQWSAANLSTIIDKSAVPVILPPASPSWDQYYVPPTPKAVKLVGEGTSLTLAASPDFSSHALMQAIGGASKSLDVMIYQITGQDIVEKLLSLAQSGVSVRLLVSSKIYDPEDCALANAAYTKMVNTTKITIRKTTSFYVYSHQKFWIVDGSEVGMSTGNWGESDFPVETSSSDPVTFPPYGVSAWRKLNRDFTMYANSPDIAKIYQDVFDGDMDTGNTFPRPVYPWTQEHQVDCGFA